MKFYKKKSQPMNKQTESETSANYSHGLTAWDKIMLFVFIGLLLYVGYRGMKWLFTSGVKFGASASIPLPTIPAPSSGMSVTEVMNVLNR